MKTQNEHNCPNSQESKIVYAGQTKILTIKAKNDRFTCGFTKPTQLKKVVDFHAKERILIIVKRETSRKEKDMITAKDAQEITLQHSSHWNIINEKIMQAAYRGENKCRINGELTELEYEALINLGYFINFINVTPFDLEHTIISW